MAIFNKLEKLLSIPGIDDNKIKSKMQMNLFSKYISSKGWHVQCIWSFYNSLSYTINGLITSKQTIIWSFGFEGLCLWWLIWLWNVKCFRYI